MKKDNAIFNLWKIAVDASQSANQLIGENEAIEEISEDQIKISSVWIESFQKSIIIFLTLKDEKLALVTGTGEDFSKINIFYGIVALNVTEKINEEFPVGKGSFLIGEELEKNLCAAIKRKYDEGGFKTNTLNNSNVTWSFSIGKLDQLKRVISDSGKINEELETDGILDQSLNKENAPYYGNLKSSRYGIINEKTLDDFAEKYKESHQEGVGESSEDSGETFINRPVVGGELIVKSPVKSSDGSILAKLVDIGGKKYLDMKLKEDPDIFATANGKINSISKSNIIDGQKIIIYHDKDGKFQSIIEGLSIVNVSENQEVMTGEKLGSGKRKILIMFIENGIEKNPMDFFSTEEEDKSPNNQESEKEETLIPTTFPLSKNKEFTSPVVGDMVVGSGYTMRMHPIYKKLQHHGGLDIKSKNNSPLFAIEDGVISNIKPNNGDAGNSIYLEGGEGREWAYFHLSSFSANKGDRVNRGDVIGRTGSTGAATGPHLHLQLKVNGNKVDPANFFDKMGISYRWEDKDKEAIHQKSISDTEISSRSGRDEKTTFLQNAYPIAKEMEQKYGVPAIVTLSMASLESGYGKSSIGPAKNFFGMKGEGPEGSFSAETMEEYTSGEKTKIKDGFRMYSSMKDSFEDYAKTLSTSSRYSYAARKYFNDPAKFILYIWGNGYATDSEYFFSLVGVSSTIARILGEPSLRINPTPEDMALAKKLSKLDPQTGERRNQTLALLGEGKSQKLARISVREIKVAPAPRDIAIFANEKDNLIWKSNIQKIALDYPSLKLFPKERVENGFEATDQYGYDWLMDEDGLISKI